MISQCPNCIGLVTVKKKNLEFQIKAFEETFTEDILEIKIKPQNATDPLDKVFLFKLIVEQMLGDQHSITE